MGDELISLTENKLNVEVSDKNRSTRFFILNTYEFNISVFFIVCITAAM
jgi:hypothetical protein